MIKKYERYKNSGVEWVEKIPEHWEIRRLATFGIFSKGSGLPKSELVESGVPAILYGDIYTKYNLKAVNIINHVTKKSSLNAKEIKKGDILFTGSGETKEDIGKCIVYLGNENIYAGGDIIVFHQNKYDSLFLSYSLNSSFAIDQKIVSAKGEIIVHIYSSKIKEIYITIPPISEQQKIASYLDKKSEEINQFIKNKQQLINLLEEEKKATITKALTKGLDKNVRFKNSEVEWLGEIPEHWEVRKIKYLFEIRKRIAGTLGYDVLSITQRGIKIKDITSGDGQLSMDYSKYQLVKVGDFAMNHMDLITGYVDISQYDGVTSPDYRVFSLTDKNSIASYFLYLFQICYLNKTFFAFGQGSSELGRWRFPASQFNIFLLPYPSKEEQQQIVAYLNEETQKIDDLKAKYQQEIDLIKEYKERLIYDVVTGKINVL